MYTPTQLPDIDEIRVLVLGQPFDQALPPSIQTLDGASPTAQSLLTWLHYLSGTYLDQTPRHIRFLSDLSADVMLSKTGDVQ